MNAKVLWAGTALAALFAGWALVHHGRERSTNGPSITVGDVLLASGGPRINQHHNGLSRDGRALPENARNGPWACYPTLGDSLRVLGTGPEGVYRVGVISGVERGCEGWVLGSAFATDSELRGPVIDTAAAERAGRIAREAWIASCMSHGAGRTRASCEAISKRIRDSLNSPSFYQR
jgi:hypothetical protein